MILLHKITCNSRKCRNWQTSKTKDLVLIASVRVQVPPSASFKREQPSNWLLFFVIINFYNYNQLLATLFYFPTPALRPLRKCFLKNGYATITGMIIRLASAILRDSVGTAPITAPLTFSFVVR